MRSMLLTLSAFLICAPFGLASLPVEDSAFFAPQEKDLPDGTATALTANSGAGQLQVRNLRGGGPIIVWIRVPGGRFVPTRLTPGNADNSLKAHWASSSVWSPPVW